MPKQIRFNSDKFDRHPGGNDTTGFRFTGTDDPPQERTEETGTE